MKISIKTMVSDCIRAMLIDGESFDINQIGNDGFEIILNNKNKANVKYTTDVNNLIKRNTDALYIMRGDKDLEVENP